MSQEKKHTSHNNGWLYVLGYRETSEFCKIGITTRSVGDRIREMQTGSPYTIYAYAIFNASWIEDLGALEQKCHNLFRGFRAQGEWFGIDPSAAKQRIREEYGPKGKRTELPLFIEWLDDKRVEDPDRATFLKNEIVLDNWLDYNFWQRATVEDVARVLDRGADIEARDGDGWTPLHLAARYNKINIVLLLLDRGADIEARTKDGRTPLHLAGYRETTDMVSLLLDRGANIEARTKDGRTPLHLAGYRETTDMVSLLLDRGADIENCNEWGGTPLHLAARWSKAEVAALLMDRGADIEARNEDGFTSLHLAARYDKINIVSLLLDRGADIEARDENGFTSLHLATRDRETTDMISLLLDRGADIEARNEDGFTSLHLAAGYDKTNMVSLLLDRGADIEAFAEDGETPLYVAAKNSKPEIVSLLLNRETDATQKIPFNYAKGDITQKRKEQINEEITRINKANQKYPSSSILERRMEQQEIKEYEKFLNDLKRSIALLQRRAKLRIIKKEYKKSLVDLKEIKRKKKMVEEIETVHLQKSNFWKRIHSIISR